MPIPSIVDQDSYAGTDFAAHEEIRKLRAEVRAMRLELGLPEEPPRPYGPVRDNSFNGLMKRIYGDLVEVE